MAKFKTGDRVTINDDRCGEIAAVGAKPASGEQTYTVTCDDGTTAKDVKESQLTAE